MSASIRRAVMLRLREGRIATGLLVVAVLGAGLFDGRLRSTFGPTLSPAVLAFGGFLLAVMAFDTTRLSGHLDLVERFPVSRARAWAIDGLAAAIVLALMLGAAAASADAAHWKSLAGGCVAAFGVGALASSLTRHALLQLVLASVVLLGGTWLALDSFAWWGMSPTPRNLALPETLAGVVLVATSLALRCWAPPGVASLRRRARPLVAVLTVGTLLVVGIGAGAIHLWMGLPRNPEFYSVAPQGPAVDDVVLLKVMTPLGTHLVSARIDRPGEWIDLGRDVERLGRDPAEPSRWFYRIGSRPTVRGYRSAWLARGEVDGTQLEELVPLEVRGRGRTTRRNIGDWSPDGAWLTLFEWEEEPPMNETLDPRAVILDRHARRVHEIPARDTTISEWVKGGAFFEIGPVGEGSLPDLVVDLLHEPTTGREIRIERPRRWLAHDEGSGRWLFERVAVDGDLACTSLVLREAFVPTERVVLDQEIPCMPAEAAPQVNLKQDFPQFGGIWFLPGGSRSGLRPSVVVDEHLRRAAVLLARVEGDWVVSQMIAVDLVSGDRRVLLPESRMPRTGVRSAQLDDELPALLGLTGAGIITWRHAEGVDVTAWSGGATAPLARWPSPLAGWRLEIRLSPSGSAVVTEIREEGYGHRIESWKAGVPRLLFRTEHYPTWSFLDETHLFTSGPDHALLVPLDGSPPQVLFP